MNTINFTPGRHDGKPWSADDHPTLQKLIYLDLEADTWSVMSGWVSPEVAKLVKAAPDLLTLARQYASECGECGGTGLHTIHTHSGGIDIDADDQPCPDCADIRAVIAKATA